MVQTVLNNKGEKDNIILTSFTFEEIINLLPIIFDFQLSGSEGFPSNLETGTFDGVSYVVPSGLSANVTALHEYLYGEKNYVPTDSVTTVDSAITARTGISEYSAGYNPTEIGKNSEPPTEEATTENTDYDYDDKGKSDFY